MPSSAVISPAAILSRVDLPEPLRPTECQLVARRHRQFGAIEQQMIARVSRIAARRERAAAAIWSISMFGDGDKPRPVPRSTTVGSGHRCRRGMSVIDTMPMPQVGRDLVGGGDTRRGKADR